MRILILSDTHARDSGSAAPGVAEHLFTAEVILHVGDICVASVLEELSTYAPVHAVLGSRARQPSSRDWAPSIHISVPLI
jgi:predicted phosphodiesterase